MRNIVGTTIQLPHDWFIDGSFLYGEADSTQYVYNGINRNRLQQALNGTLPGLVGQFFNPFTDQNLNIHPNRVFYPALRTEQIQDNRTDLVQWTIKAGGTIIELPAGPLTAAGGLEYHSESLIQSNDKNSEFNNVTSPDFPGRLLSARRYVRSAYGELDIPLVGQKWSWPGLRNMDLVFSERYDNYSDFGGAGKPKIAIRYKPFQDLTFRGSYAEGFIAPTLGELFGAQIHFQTVVNDPQNNNLPSTAVETIGGNPNLQPEVKKF